MSDALLFGIIIVGIFALLLVYYAFKKFKNFKKKPKEKKIKTQKIKISKQAEELDLRGAGSYVDASKKFLFRKELKFIAHVSRILPPEYVVFPKVGLDLILEPVGNKDLYNSVANKYVDMIIFEEATMKPVLAIDTYDGTIGNEQLDLKCPNVVKALEAAELPLLEFKIKNDYTEAEIKQPVFEALGLNKERK